MIQVIGKIGKPSEADKIEYLISNTSFERVGETLYAVQPSCSQPGETHRVSIDETGELLQPVKCNCWGFSRHGHCVNMLAVAEYYSRKAAERETFYAERRQPALTPDEIAAIAEQANMQKLAEYRKHTAINAYEQLASTKQVTKQVDYCDCCGKPCHGGICGACLA